MNFTATLAQLDDALTATGRIVAGVRSDQWELPSPCADWDVRQVANHLVGGLCIFTGQLTGDTVTSDHDGHDWLGPSPSDAYDGAADLDQKAWRREGADLRVFDLAFGQVPAPMALVVHLTEVVVHGLDLAVATGQEHVVDQDLAAHLLATMRGMGTDAFRVPGIFGPELQASQAAPAHRQLLAYLGRELSSLGSDHVDKTAQVKHPNNAR
jgi:uncharacterized protein (TIGR03086 family)